MTALALFASTYLLVLFLGLQSLNVNGGHRLLPGPTGAAELLAYLAGGPAGILTSMAIHPWMVQKFGRKTP